MRNLSVKNFLRFMNKNISYFFQSIVIYFFFIFSKIIGLRLSRILFSKIFIYFGNMFKSKKIISQNLDKIMPNINNQDKESIINKMWSNYGKTFIEYIYLKKFKKGNSHISIKNKRIIDKIVSNNKPVIFISGHFANYELMSMELTKSNVNLATIYRPLNNFFLNPFMEYLRKNFICKSQIKKGLPGVKETINYLKKNYCIALMVDQRVSEGIKVPFFNNVALTTSLPAQLAIKYNCEIVPIYISRNIKDNFEMEIYEPIKFSEEEKNNKLLITKRINVILEKLILRDPSQWILTHNRWK